MKVRFNDYLRAGYPALCVNTHEEGRAIAVLSAEAEGYQVYKWDIVSGLVNGGAAQDMPDPILPIQAIPSLPDRSILWLKDYHKFLGSVEVFRTIKNMLPVCKSKPVHIVFVGPVVDIPIELSKDIKVIDFDLPGVDELLQVAGRIVAENELDIEVDRVAVESGKGLTLGQAEDSIALSLAVSKGFSRSIIEGQKLGIIRQSGLMELFNPVAESELGGVPVLKQYLHSRKRGLFNKDIPVAAKPGGIILCGPPGTGKSLSAKVVSSIFGIPLLRADVNQMKGSLVGESSANMKRFLETVKAVSPCVVWFDEFEKMVAGMASSGKTDSGTTIGMIGQLMSAMQDFKESGAGVYWVATLNDMSPLIENSQGALLRRFDDIFFVDLPGPEDRADILSIMNRRYGTDIRAEVTAKMSNWSGAEIEKFVQASIYDGINSAFDNVRPVYNQARIVIEQGRQWALNNARLASGSNEQIEKRRVTV